MGCGGVRRWQQVVRAHGRFYEFVAFNSGRRYSSYGALGDRWCELGCCCAGGGFRSEEGFFLY